MKSILVLCALVAFTQAFSLNHRIVGGQDAEVGQFKHQASLRSGNFHFCGATVVSRRTLVTAAHCRIYDPSQTVAVLGTNRQDDDSARRYEMQDFIIHPDYDASTISNDVAVIILKEDIEFNDLVQPLELASRPIEAGQRLTSSGWGYTSYPGSAPNVLQWMMMNVMSKEDCGRITGQALTGKICTLEEEGKGVCSGDSGGPLVNADNELVGITSAAYLCALGLPDFFTDVYYFKDWILENGQF